MKRIRVVLDTNLWISYLISKRLERVEQLLANEKIVLLFSEALLSEFLEVAHRPKFRKYFPKIRIAELLDLFDHFGEMVKVTSTAGECRDAKDNFLLSLAKDGKADCLMTGDGDLLDIETFGNTQIMTYHQFEQKISL